MVVARLIVKDKPLEALQEAKKNLCLRKVVT